jgi:hypothetical protein
MLTSAEFAELVAYHRKEPTPYEMMENYFVGMRHDLQVLRVLKTGENLSEMKPIIEADEPDELELFEQQQEAIEQSAKAWATAYGEHITDLGED